MVPKIEDIWLVVIWQGGTAEATIDGVNETSNRMTNTAIILVADRCPKGEIAMEQ